MAHFLRTSIKYWWVVLIITAITTGSAFYMSYYFLPKEYKATTTIYVIKKAANQVTNNDTTYQDLLASDMLVKDFKEMVKSTIVIQKLKAELQNEVSWYKTASIKDISNTIDVKAKVGTRLIEVDVVDQDPKSAALVANTLTEIFKNRAKEILNVDNVAKIDEAMVPDSPSNPKPLQNIALGLLSGIICGLAIIGFIDYLRRQVLMDKKPEGNLAFQN